MTDSTLLAGRRAMVTGGSGGLGAAFAEALVAAGARVVAVDLVASPRPTGDAGIRHLAADLTDPDSVNAAMEEATHWLGGLDLLVNNAGVAARSTPLDPLPGTRETFAALLEANLLTAVLTTRAAVSHLVASGAADVVNVVTDHVHTCWWPVPVDHAEAPDCPWVEQPRRPGWVGMDLYDASKWALWGITRTWAMTLRPTGVRVNALSMGATDSPMQRAHLGYRPEDALPPDLLAKWLDPGDVARVLVELVGEGPGGRSGDSVAVWPHHPVVLRAPTPELNLVAGWDPATDLRGRPAAPREEAR